MSGLWQVTYRKVSHVSSSWCLNRSHRAKLRQVMLRAMSHSNEEDKRISFMSQNLM